MADTADVKPSMSGDRAPGKGVSWGQIAPFVIIVALLVLASALGLFRYLTLDTLREQRTNLQAMAAAHPVSTLVGYIAIYAVATLCMVPGTMWITVTGGMMFGFATGAPATVLAGSIGGVALFLAAKSSLGSFLHARAGKWLLRLEAGFREDALSYMFAMRFMPVVPYPVANLAPALLGAKLRDFLISTPIGLTPSICAYTLLGTGLGASLAAGEEPDLMRLAINLAPAFIALGVIALAPVAYKYLVGGRDSSDINTGNVEVATEKEPEAS